MKKILSTLITLAAFAAPSAFAADMPVRPLYKYEAPQMQVFNWTGFYVGAHVGYGMADLGGIDADGFTGGLQAGYNWQFSRNIIFGLEADISGTDMSGSLGGIHGHIDYLGTARARIGYAWDRAMLYGTGGLAFSRAAALGLHGSDMGYALGLGLEWAFMNGWSAKAEYMYYSLDDSFDVSMIKLGVNYRFNSVF